MTANLTMTEGGLVVEQNGMKVKLSDSLLLLRQPAWHGSGHIIPAGATAYDGYKMLDPKGHMDTHMEPLFIVGADGKMQRVPFSMVVRNPAVDDDAQKNNWVLFGNPVNSGEMSLKDWQDMNPDSPTTPIFSKGFELIPTKKLVDIIDEHVLDTEGQKVVWESLGFLGEYGKDGLFMTTKLRPWEEHVANKLGTNVDEYFNVYYNQRSHRVYFYNTSIVAVCQNTVYMSLRVASTVLRVESRLGAAERLVSAIGKVHGTAIAARQLEQEAAEFLAGKTFSAASMRSIAQDVYRDAEEPDRTLEGVISLEVREEAYEKRQQAQEMKREALVQIFEDENFHQIAGITPQVKGTAWAAFQAVTFMETYAPADNPESRLRQLADGSRRRNILRGFDSIMTVADPQWKNKVAAQAV